MSQYDSDRQDQLRTAGKQKEQGQRPLKGSQGRVHKPFCASVLAGYSLESLFICILLLILALVVHDACAWASSVFGLRGLARFQREQ